MTAYNTDFSNNSATYRHYSESTAESTTTGTALVDKIAETTGGLVAGTYRLDWSAELKISVVTASARVVVEIDGSSVVDGLVGCTAYARETASTEIALVSGVHTIKIRFARSGGTVETASIKNARVSLYRVA